MSGNRSDDVRYTQPRDIEERLAIARDFAEHFDHELPLVVDTLENEAMEAYAAWPERLYVIDESGTIAYKGGMGPMFYDPGEVEDWLEDRFGE